MVNTRKYVPPVYFFLTIILMVLLHYFLPVYSLLNPPVSYIGLVPLVAGFAIAVWSANLFKKAETPIKPFEESTILVKDGMYRVTRNPMYLGMVLALLGIALLLGSLSPFLLVPLFAWFIHSQFVVHEEVMLETLFGEEYLHFKAMVRRWF